MTRSSITFPEKFSFTVELTVRVTDINYGGHLGNDALLGLVHEARLAWLQQHGFSETDAGGVGLIMTNLSVVFRSEAFRGDRLRLEVAVTDPGRSSFNLVYRMTRSEDGQPIADVRTGMTFFDYDRRRPARMPEAFRVILDLDA